MRYRAVAGELVVNIDGMLLAIEEEAQPVVAARTDLPTPGMEDAENQVWSECGQGHDGGDQPAVSELALSKKRAGGFYVTSSCDIPPEKTSAW